MNLTAKERRLISERDGGRCLMCGARATNVHHRRSRGMGGTKQPAPASELVSLCGSGTTGCHGVITANPGWAYQNGWSIRRTDIRPAQDVPIVLDQGSMFLTDDYRIELLP